MDQSALLDPYRREESGRHVTNWMVECGSPNIMLRRGFTKRSLEVGTELAIQGYQAKNGRTKANGSSVTFKDGKNCLSVDRTRTFRKSKVSSRGCWAFTEGSSRMNTRFRVRFGRCAFVLAGSWPKRPPPRRPRPRQRQLDAAENRLGRSRPSRAMAGHRATFPCSGPPTWVREPSSPMRNSPSARARRKSRRRKPTAKNSHTRQRQCHHQSSFVLGGARQAGPSSFAVIDPPNGRIPPLTPEGQAAVKGLRGGLGPGSHFPDKVDSWEDFDIYSRCITRGLVSSMLPTLYNFGNEILQAPGYVIIRNEMIHETRVIPVGRASARGQGHPHCTWAIRAGIGKATRWWWKPPT